MIRWKRNVGILLIVLGVGGLAGAYLTDGTPYSVGGIAIIGVLLVIWHLESKPKDKGSADDEKAD